jgi:cyclic dehypoxanthinyl futalosine synthase
MNKEQTILDAVVGGQRLNLEDAKYLLEKGNWTRLAEAAHEVRNQLHNPGIVSYTAFRLINYTNYCNVECTFCSFMDEIDSGKGYNLNLEQMSQKADEAKAHGADQIFLQGGVNPRLPLDYYTDALQLLGHEKGMHVRGFSPVELKRLSEKLKKPLPDLLHILKEAGLASVPGAGAEILTENMRRKLSPRKLSAAQWCEVMGECHKAGLNGSANIVFGSTETSEDIVQHLNFVREQQDRTGGFLTFVPWKFQPQTKNFPIKNVRQDQYLKILSLARLFFDNIQHMETSILVMGKDVGQLALHCGADDINSIVIEENVLASQGLKTLRAAEKFILEAGYTPKRRDLSFDFSKYENQDPVYDPNKVSNLFFA